MKNLLIIVGTIFTSNSLAFDCSTARTLLNGTHLIKDINTPCYFRYLIEIAADCKTVKVDSSMVSTPNGNCQQQMYQAGAEPQTVFEVNSSKIYNGILINLTTKELIFKEVATGCTAKLFRNPYTFKVIQVESCK